MGEPGRSTLRTPSRIAYRLGDYEVEVSTLFGPRILGLRVGDGPEQLVSLAPEAAVEGGPDGRFLLRGGHRLWASPERPELTYAADDEPCRVSYEDGILTVAGPTDRAGFRKGLRVQVDEEGLVVDHRLQWEGSEPVTAGVWAVTQFPLGGTAFLPLRAGADSPALQADRSLVLWPYTDLADPRLEFGRSAVAVRARPGPRLKLGSSPAPGPLGYLRDGWLFTKTADAANEDRAYPDRGAVGQVFVNEHFCEVESLGELEKMQPGDAISHREVWQVSPCPDAEAALEGVAGSP